MKPRSALIVAAVLTTFVLVLVGAVINRLIQPSPAELAAAADLSASPVPIDDLQATTTAREAAYEQQLAEASARIEEANQALTQAYDELSQPVPPVLADPPPQAVFPDASQSAPALPESPPAQSESPPAVVPAAPPAPPAPAPARISSEQAVAAAIAYLGNSPIKEVKLEEEHGALVYEVRFENDNRVYIDPATGRVIYAKTKDRDSNSGSGGDDDK